MKMPTQNTPAVESTPQPTVEQALAHLSKVRTGIFRFIGKEGYNPFIYETSKLLPLEARLKKGDQSAISEVLALDPAYEPKIETPVPLVKIVI